MHVIRRGQHLLVDFLYAGPASVGTRACIVKKRRSIFSLLALGQSRAIVIRLFFATLLGYESDAPHFPDRKYQ